MATPWWTMIVHMESQNSNSKGILSAHRLWGHKREGSGNTRTAGPARAEVWGWFGNVALYRYQKKSHPDGQNPGTFTGAYIIIYIYMYRYTYRYTHIYIHILYAYSSDSKRSAILWPRWADRADSLRFRLLQFDISKRIYSDVYTLWLFNIAMENDPFIDGLPITHGDFPWLC